jgi:hypothetical protein
MPCLPMYCFSSTYIHVPLQYVRHTTIQLLNRRSGTLYFLISNWLIFYILIISWLKISNLVDLFKQPVASAQVQLPLCFYFLYKVVSLSWKHRKILNYFTLIRLTIFYISVCLSSTHFWVTLSLKYC